MLNKGLKDQESIRIDSILQRLHSLILVPKFWDLKELLFIENELKDLGLNLNSLSDFDEMELIIHLKRFHLDWNQLELFADFLIDFSKERPFNFSEKSIAIYHYIQQESKLFSFGINAKIINAKAYFK